MSMYISLRCVVGVVHALSKSVKSNQGSTPLAIFEAQVVLFEVKWLGRLQRGITSSQERYSSHLCGIFFHTLVLEYDMHLAMQCSSILYNNYTL